MILFVLTLHTLHTMENNNKTKYGEYEFPSEMIINDNL